MTEITIKNHTYTIRLAKDSFSRRAVQYTNKLLESFRRIGVGEDDVEISEERLAIRKAPASASWWIDDRHCHFSYNKFPRFIDNLVVISHVLQQYIQSILQETITLEEFIEAFKEHNNIEEQRAEAREFFGLDEHHVDLESINKQYKKLAKTLHPDMSTGDIHKFKELNHHHKVLKRELT